MLYQIMGQQRQNEDIFSYTRLRLPFIDPQWKKSKIENWRGIVTATKKWELKLIKAVGKFKYWLKETIFVLKQQKQYQIVIKDREGLQR